MSHQRKTEFTVATIGFDEREKNLLQGMLAMSSGRAQAFQSYIFDRHTPADMAIIDYANDRALNGWLAYQGAHTEQDATIPFIAVSRRAPPDVSWWVRRPVIAARLLATLEQVAVEALGFQSTDAPELPADIPVPDLEVPGAADAAGGVRALGVDDSLPVRMQMQSALNEVANHVDYAESGAKAHGLLEHNRYDIVFLDVTLPDADGYEICKAIKSKPESVNTPVIMLTSTSAPADRVKGRTAGCDTYLIKPVKKAVFEEVVRDYMKPLAAA